jgi:hypothetical protein
VHENKPRLFALFYDYHRGLDISGAGKYRSISYMRAYRPASLRITPMEAWQQRILPTHRGLLRPASVPTRVPTDSNASTYYIRIWDRNSQDCLINLLSTNQCLFVPGHMTCPGHDYWQQGDKNCAMLLGRSTYIAIRHAFAQFQNMLNFSCFVKMQF